MRALIQCNTAYLYHSASETYTEGNKEIRLKERHALLLRIIRYGFLIFKAEPNNLFSFSIIFLINRCLQVVKKIPSGILKANTKLFNVKPGKKKKDLEPANVWRFHWLHDSSLIIKMVTDPFSVISPIDQSSEDAYGMCVVGAGRSWSASLYFWPQEVV